jgi:hypothetical protein
MAVVINEVVRVDVLWPDANLESLSLTYDSITLVVREDEGRRRIEILGSGPIGLELTALWDDLVIAAGRLSPDHDFADRTWERIKSHYQREPPDTGSPSRNRRRFTTLEVTFVDGSQLLCAAAEFASRPLLG